MRLLAIDYGSKRIGVAAADTQVGLAFARPVLDSTGSRGGDAAVIAQIAHMEGIDLVLVGLPMLESGKEGTQASISREFGEELVRMGCNVEYVDERYTSAIAEMSLQHVNPKKRKQIADSEAARILLVEYLSRQDA